MARPRMPKAKAKILGSDVVNPERFAGRTEPKNIAAIADPPDWMNEVQIKAWDQFKSELPWLNESHRALLEIAATVRARLMVPQVEGKEVGVQALNLLRQCLGQMGATPADATKVTMPDGEEDKDPADKYFN